MTIFQIRRTETPGNQPPPLSLFAGELAVDMAEPSPRLWVGVPSTIDPTGQRLVINASDYLPLVGGVLTGPLGITDGTQTWTTSVAGTYTLADTNHDRLIINPSTAAATPVRVIIGDNSLTIGENLYFGGAPGRGMIHVAPDITYFIAGPTPSGSGSAWIWTSSLNVNVATLSTDGVFASNGVVVRNNQYITNNDATLTLEVTEGAGVFYRWDLIAQADQSSAPHAFTIADANTGDRRFNIHPGTGLVELLATGELLLAVDPTSPMGAVTKQYADTIAAGGAFLPLVGGVLTGDLGMTDGTQTWTQSVAGAFSITDTTNAQERFRIGPEVAPVPSQPVIVHQNALTIGQTLYLNGETSGGQFAIGGPMLFANDAEYVLKTGVTPGAVFVFRFGGTAENLATLSSTGSFILWNNPGLTDPDGTSISSDIIGARLCYKLEGVNLFTISGPAQTPDFNFWDHGPDATQVGNEAIRITFEALTGVTNNNAMAHVFRSHDTLTEYARIDGTGLHVNNLAVTAAGVPGVGGDDATISLVSGAQTWDLIAQSAGSSAPGAFTISDALTGTRRLVIEPAIPFGLQNTMPAPVVITGGGAIMLNNEFAAVPAGGRSFIFSDPNQIILSAGPGYGVVRILNSGTIQSDAFNFNLGPDQYTILYAGYAGGGTTDSHTLARPASGVNYHAITLIGGSGFPTAGQNINETHYKAARHVFADQVGLDIQPAEEWGAWNATGLTVKTPLMLAADPVQPLEAVTKQYVDAVATGGVVCLPIAGGTMTGPIGMTDGTQTWTASVADNLVLTDTTTAIDRLIIEPAVLYGLVQPTYPDPVVISGGAIILNAKNVAYPPNNTGPLIYTSPWSMELRTPAATVRQQDFSIRSQDGAILLSLSDVYWLYCENKEFLLIDGFINPQLGYKLGQGLLLREQNVSVGAADQGTYIRNLYDCGYAAGANYPEAPRIQILGAVAVSDSSLPGGSNYYNATEHLFRSHDTLTTFGTFDAAGLTLAVDPTLDMHAATKLYVDTQIALPLASVAALEARIAALEAQLAAR